MRAERSGRHDSSGPPTMLGHGSRRRLAMAHVSCSDNMHQSTVQPMKPSIKPNSGNHMDTEKLALGNTMHRIASHHKKPNHTTQHAPHHTTPHPNFFHLHAAWCVCVALCDLVLCVGGGEQLLAWHGGARACGPSSPHQRSLHCPLQTVGGRPHPSRHRGAGSSSSGGSAGRA